MHNGYGFVLQFPAMKRRDLLKALPAIAVSVSALTGNQTTAMFKLPADHKVIAFVNTDAIPLEMFSKLKFPMEVTLIPISLSKGQTFDEAIRLYDVDAH